MPPKSKNVSNGQPANLGSEIKLWLAADKLRNSLVRLRKS